MGEGGGAIDRVAGRSEAQRVRPDEASAARSVGKRTLVEQAGAERPSSTGFGGAVEPAGLAAEPTPDTAAAAKTMDRAVVNGGEIPYRARMEQAFGADFGSVRATVGASAALGELGAIGAARGEEVAFRSSSPDPAVVAHELAHVVQRRRNASGASTAVEDENSSAEHEAEHVGALVAAGEQAPPITQVPTGLVTRAIPRQAPPAPAQVSAGEWLDHMLLMSPLRPQVAAQLVGAELPIVHPRLVWSPGGALLQRVWSNVGNAARLQLVVAPFDLLARIDRMRELTEQTGKGNVGPLSYVPEVAPIIAREIETAIGRCVQRLGPRLVTAYDARMAPSTGMPATRDAATLPADSIVMSHPLDRIVEDAIRQGAIATLRTRGPADDEPAADRVVPGAIRAITYRWAEDPALWNWIRTEPADATPEEVAKLVLGSTARAYEIQGSAPFFALPASEVNRIAPERSTPAALKVGDTMHKPGFADAAEELQHGVSETALARSKIGEQAALAQAEHAGDHATAAQGNADTADLAARCQSQVHLLTDSYPQLGAGPKLAAMAARLAGRTKRLPTMQAADYGRFGKLFAEQSSVLYAVAGDLETLATQAKKLQLASGPAAPIDPTLAEIAALVLEAGASSDLPETARKQLALAHARHASIPFDVMEAMLDDARARTMATDALAETWGPGDSGSTKTSPPMTGREQWQDLRGRETKLSGDVLAARRAHDAGTEKAGATRTLAERTRALQVEARVVAAETQCAYMGDKLEEQEGIVATVARQMSDLQNARNGLRALANTMAGIRIRWREKHAQLFALVESGTGAKAEADPASVIRQAIAELETELAQVGDDKARTALQTAQSELKDMAVARAVADIAIMIGLTLVTSALGSAASGAARGLKMGPTVAQLVNVATQSVAMATLRTILYHDSFSSAFGTELLTNFAGLAALRGVAAGLSKLKLGKALAVLKEGGGGWKYVAYGTELTIEAATQAGMQFAVAEAESVVRQGRTLDDDDLKMLAIQGIGMFAGNAIAHRLTSPAMDAIAAYAAKIGAPYRRAKVLALVDQMNRARSVETANEVLREERALLAEELALLERIARDPAERAQFGEKTLATVTDQAHQQAGELKGVGVERALQGRLAEISPGKAFEGATSHVEPALVEAQAAGASIQHEQLPDGTRRHTVTAGTKRYIVYEHGSTSPKHAAEGEHGAPNTADKADRVAQIDAALGKKVKPEDVKALTTALGDDGMIALAKAAGDHLPELVADAGSAATIASVKKFGPLATAKLLKGLGGKGVSKLVADLEEIGLQLATDGDRGSYRWGATGKTEKALSGGIARVHKSSDPTSGARTLDVETPAGPVKLEERGRYAEVHIDPSKMSPEDAQHLGKLFADYGIVDDRAKQPIIEALENARLGSNAPDFAAAIKKVRPLLDEATATAKKASDGGAPTTAQDVILANRNAPLSFEADGPAVTEAKALIAGGILLDPEFQSARTPPEGRDAVSQRLQASVAMVRAEGSFGKRGGKTFTRIKFKGDLFVDETSANHFVGSEGRPIEDTDVAPDIDVAYVVEIDGKLNIEYVAGVKIVKNSAAVGASADAANQNRLAKAAVQAGGKRFPTTIRRGDHVWAEVKSVSGTDDTGAKLDLTGKLVWDPAAKTETIGSKGTRAFDANLPVSRDDLDKIVLAIWRLAEQRKR